MAIKKFELYASIWSGCCELRGDMDASQYKDYVLVLLNTKFISDKYTGLPCTPVTVLSGVSFADMVAFIAAEIAALEAKLSKTRKLKQEMMQKLFSGRILLV